LRCSFLSNYVCPTRSERITLSALFIRRTSPSMGGRSFWEFFRFAKRPHGKRNDASHSRRNLFQSKKDFDRSLFRRSVNRNQSYRRILTIACLSPING